MEYFNLLADKVTQLWRNDGYDDARFPACALEALRVLPPREHTSFEEIAYWAVGANAIPTQADLDENFGQPPLTVFFGHEFRIEALFWIVGVPGVHQHGFSGAFHVMEGSSLHCTYQFAADKKLARRLVIGDLRLEKLELLKAGATRTIRAGPDFIHATFHLDRPSISIIIRTHRDQEHLPQYSYLAPSIAYDPNEMSPLLLRRCQILAMLAATERFETLARAFRHVCEFDDPATIFFALQKLYPMLGPMNREKLLVMAQQRSPELACAARPAFRCAEKRDKVLKLRRSTKDPELQFFLALLLYVNNCESILDMVHQAFPDRDPVVQLLQWIKQLSVTTDALNGMTEDWLKIVERQLASSTPEKMLDRCSAQTSQLGQQNGAVPFNEVRSDLRNHWMLQPLFEHSKSVPRGETL